MIEAMTTEELDAILGQSADAGFGAIETPRGCLPLVAMELDVSIDGLVAHGKVSQTFRNVFAEPLEATYVFPLPPRGAVIGFRMMVDGAIIEGRIDERSRAREDYDAAIRAGRSAAIAEEERPDVFTIRVGNIPARTYARIEFTLVAPLAIDTLEATYRFPLVVARRYCPGTPLDGAPVGDGVLPDTDLVPDGSRISPPVLLRGFPNPVRLAIRATIETGPNATGLPRIATSIPARDHLEGTKLVVTAEPGQRLDRDFILRWQLPVGPVAGGSVAIEPDATRPVGMGRREGSREAPGDGTFSCVILPPAVAPGSREPRDVVFVLDRSGSMGAWQIGAARRAVGRMIDTLSGDDRVGVIAFDTSIEHFGESLELVPATDGQRWEILEWLEGIGARGGTEMAAPLEAGLKLLARAAASPASVSRGRSAMLVLITDGQIGDEEHVLSTLVTSLGTTALHVVGIDTAINEGLLSRLADASGGSLEIVESEQRLDAVMDRIQGRLVPPLFTDIRLEGDGLELFEESLVPARIPDLHPGVPIVLRGRCRTSGHGTVKIHGRHRDGTAWHLDLAPVVSQAAGLGALWARGRLRNLEDAYALARANAAAPIEERLVDLSTGFGVLCRFTAVVAVDAREPVAKGPLRRIVQPVSTAAIDRLLGFDIAPSGHAPADCFALLSCERSEYHLAPEFLDAWDDRPMPASPPLYDCLAEKAMLRETLALVKPRSGAIADMPGEMRDHLFAEVRKVIELLRASAVPEIVIATLERPLQKAILRPENARVLRALLEAVATFAEPVERWWKGTGRKRSPHRPLLPLVLACSLLVPGSAAAAALDASQAVTFARLALEGIAREYPNKPADVLNGDADVQPPRRIHPAFHGCYDWHSAVHGHWMLVRLLRRFPDLPVEGEIRAALAANLTRENLATEATFFSRPGAKSYERPYGWSWLLKLAEELHGWDDPQGREWSANLRPLVDTIVASYLDYFPKQTYPIRSGVHSSTAFGLTFALDYARAVGHEKLEALVIERSRSYFTHDERIPAAWEPDGADFFSPSLMEADLMRRVLPAGEFRAWFRRFLPDLAAGAPRSILDPATVTDRTDPQLVHLDGLNLSRAWCMRSIAAALAEDDPVRETLLDAADRHAAAALPHVTSGDYAGEHWLASFATWLLTSGQ